MHAPRDSSSDQQIEGFNRRLAAQVQQQQRELTLLLAKQLVPDGAVHTRRSRSFWQCFRQWIARPAMRCICSPVWHRYWARASPPTTPPPTEEDILIVGSDDLVAKAEISRTQQGLTEKEVLP